MDVTRSNNLKKVNGGLHFLVLILLTLEIHQFTQQDVKWRHVIDESLTRLLLPEPPSHSPHDIRFTRGKFLLFTTKHTIEYLHETIQNYFSIPKKAVAHFQVAPMHKLPWPELRITYTNSSIQVVTLRGTQWPIPLQKNATEEEYHQFFDQLKHMVVDVVVDSNIQEMGPTRWHFRMLYDFTSQAHLLVTTDLQQQDSRDAPRQKHYPSSRHPYIIWLLLALGLYQCGLGFQWYQSHDTKGERENSPSEGLSDALLPQESLDFESSFPTSFILAGNMVLGGSILLNQSCACLPSHTHPVGTAIYTSSIALEWFNMVYYFDGVILHFHVLVFTLSSGFRRVFAFLLGVCPLFLGYIVFGTILFGTEVEEFSTLPKTATTLFAVANGDEILDTFADVMPRFPFVGELYLYSYIVLFTYVVLMVCIGIIDDTFFTALLDLEDTQQQQQTLANDQD